MYRINYELDENGYLKHWQQEPFDEEKPYVECDEYPELIIGVTTVVDGQFVNDPEKREEYKQKLERINELHGMLGERLTWFDKYDVQVSEYNREVRIGATPSVDIEALDAQAEVYRVDIVNIRNELKELEG